ncbi:MAG: sigma-70 family RNA polymerase sigma factor [Myxococcaceae bacterium]
MVGPPYSAQVLSLDTQFVRALRQRDAAAFEALVRAFLPRVRRMAMQFFQSAAEQEDAVQEAFAHLYAHLDAVDPLRAESVPGWIVTTSRNRMLDLARQRRPGQTIELTEEVGGEEEALGPQVVLEGELQQLLLRFEEKLKPAYRPYFRAVFLEGRDWEEARVALRLSRLRTKYLKSVLLKLLQRHGPLLELVERRRQS